MSTLDGVGLGAAAGLLGLDPAPTSQTGQRYLGNLCTLGTTGSGAHVACLPCPVYFHVLL